MDYGLPKSVNIGGIDYAIRYDYRAILDIFEVLNEVNASDWERACAALNIFYVEFDDLPGYPQYTEEIREIFKFINGGKEEKKQGKKPQLVSWEMDFPYICAAVNRVLGYEIRNIPYNEETNEGGVHWYTFLSAYMEIGDCLFSQIVSIRSKKAKNKKLDKAEQEFYRRNKEIIDIPGKYADRDIDVLRKWF